jgi:hypothetical protein
VKWGDGRTLFWLYWSSLLILVAAAWSCSSSSSCSSSLLSCPHRCMLFVDEQKIVMYDSWKWTSPLHPWLWNRFWHYLHKWWLWRCSGKVSLEWLVISHLHLFLQP